MVLEQFQQRRRAYDLNRPPQTPTSDQWARERDNRTSSVIKSSPRGEPPKSDWALVVYESQQNSQLLASLWMKGSVGGEILVVTSRSEGDRNVLRRGTWLKVLYVPYSCPENDDLYLNGVNHEVLRFEFDQSIASLLPRVVQAEPLIQINTPVMMTTRVIQFSGIDESRFRLLKCPALGNAYAALIRNDQVERHVDTLKRYLKKDMRNKETEVEATLCFGLRNPFDHKQQKADGVGVYWFVSSMQESNVLSYKITCFVPPVHLVTGAAFPCEAPEHEFMTLDEIVPIQPTEEVAPDVDCSPDDEIYDDDNCYVPSEDPGFQNGRHLQECRNYEEFENFIEELLADFEGLNVDFEKAENQIKAVKVITLFTMAKSAVCFSPQYGWAVAKMSMDGDMDSASLQRTFCRGRWLSVNLFPAKARMGSSKVADWIVCPTYKPCHSPFSMFCSNRNSEVTIMEALAFNNVNQRIENNHGMRFILLDTPMGEVWLPGAVECPDPQDPDRVEIVNCPVRCQCGRNSYRSYEDPRKQFFAPALQYHSGYDTDNGTIQNFMHETSPGFQLPVPEAVDPYASPEPIPLSRATSHSHQREYQSYGGGRHRSNNFAGRNPYQCTAEPQAQRVRSGAVSQAQRRQYPNVPPPARQEFYSPPRVPRLASLRVASQQANSPLVRSMVELNETIREVQIGNPGHLEHRSSSATAMNQNENGREAVLYSDVEDEPIPIAQPKNSGLGNSSPPQLRAENRRPPVRGNKFQKGLVSQPVDIPMFNGLSVDNPMTAPSHPNPQKPAKEENQNEKVENHSLVAKSMSKPMRTTPAPLGENQSNLQNALIPLPAPQQQLEDEDSDGEQDESPRRLERHSSTDSLDSLQIKAQLTDNDEADTSDEEVLSEEGLHSLGIMAQIGLITGIKQTSDGLERVIAWVRDQAAESEISVKSGNGYKVGQWINLLRNGESFRKLPHEPDGASCQVSERRGTIRVITDVTFHGNDLLPHSDVLGVVPALDSCTVPPPGTYKSYVLYIPPEERNLRMRYRSAWTFYGLVEAERSKQNLPEERKGSQNWVQNNHPRNDNGKQPRVEDCRNVEDFRNLITSNMDTVSLLEMDIRTTIINVRMAKIFEIEDFEFFYSPQYRWCVGRKSFRDFRQGEWVSAQLVRALHPYSTTPIVDWIVHPKFVARAPPIFTVYCENPHIEGEILEALAFNNFVKCVQHETNRTRFIILATSKGKVWVPAEVESLEAPSNLELVVQCPEHCFCFGEDPRHSQHYDRGDIYAYPKESGFSSSSRSSEASYELQRSPKKSCHRFSTSSSSSESRSPITVHNQERLNVRNSSRRSSVYGSSSTDEWESPGREWSRGALEQDVPVGCFLIPNKPIIDKSERVLETHIPSDIHAESQRTGNTAVAEEEIEHKSSETISTVKRNSEPNNDDSEDMQPLTKQLLPLSIEDQPKEVAPETDSDTDCYSEPDEDHGNNPPAMDMSKFGIFNNSEDFESGKAND